MGLYRYYDPTIGKRRALKSVAIVNSDGTNEYTPNKIKAIEDDLVAHKADYVYQKAEGTATEITLTINNLKDGYPITFIANANNNRNATTINGKPLYKPNTTDTPNLVAGKAYTVWYNQDNDCFFIKASAEGNASVADVLAGKTFSNDDDTGLVGNIPIRTGAITAQSRTRSSTTLRFRPQPGYYTGDTSNYVQMSDPNFIAANILKGKTIFGLPGSLEPGKKYASGTVPVFLDGNEGIASIRGLSFKPSIIIVRMKNYSYTNRRFSIYWESLLDASIKEGGVGDKVETAVVNEYPDGFDIRVRASTSPNITTDFTWIAFE